MKELPLNSGDDYIIPLGKYKGLNIIDVYEQDPNYFEWMYNNCELSKQFALVLENMIVSGVPF